MAKSPEPVHVSLPATVRFVTIVGLIILTGWALMFRLLLERW